MIQIDIVPHDLERNIRLAHPLHLLTRFVQVLVAPPAEVEAEAPERLPGREPDERAVLLDDFLWARAGEEVEVEHAADEAVLDERDGGGGRRLEERIRASGARRNKSEYVIFRI